MRFIIYIAVIAIVLVVGYFVKKNRSGRWTELASRRGWQWIGDARPGIDEQFGSGIFAMGHGHDDEYVMRGIFDGLPVTSGIYSYITGAGRSSVTHTQRYVMTPAPSCPTLQLVRGTWWVNRRATAIKFPDDQFNKRWNVTGDEPFARAVITPQLARYLMGLEKNCGFLIEGGAVAAWVQGRTGKVDEPGLDWACRQLTAFVNAIPESVKAAFPGGFPRPDGTGPAPIPGAPIPGRAPGRPGSRAIPGAPSPAAPSPAALPDVAPQAHPQPAPGASPWQAPAPIPSAPSPRLDPTPQPSPAPQSYPSSQPWQSPSPAAAEPTLDPDATRLRPIEPPTQP